MLLITLGLAASMDESIEPVEIDNKHITRLLPVQVEEELEVVEETIHQFNVDLKASIEEIRAAQKTKLKEAYQRKQKAKKKPTKEAP